VKAAVVLAAGLSTRFPGNKLLREFWKKPLIRHTVERLVECEQIEECFVVVGGGEATIVEALAGLPLQFVEVQGEAALSESIKAGLRSLPKKTSHVMVALGDQPVSARLLTRLMAKAISSEQDVLVPTYGKQRGNPVIFRSQFFPLLFQMNGDCGARMIIDGHPELVHEFELDDVMPPDLDSEADLKNVENYLGLK